MAEDAYDLVGVLPKNAREDVRIALSEYRGMPLIDLRVFADLGAPDGERTPTRKGLALKIERLPELIRLLQDAAEEAGRRGLIGGRRNG